eukprot:8197385-Ditylum_brightwellii.AAC.1
MFADIEDVCVHIDNLLLITTGKWENQMAKPDEVSTKISFFGCQELEYLGYWMTRQGIKPLPKKVQAIIKISPPTTRKQLCSFIGMINHYCTMWQAHIKVLAPLTALMPSSTPWIWKSGKQEAFDLAKKIVN